MKLFTLEEANDLLPSLREWLLAIRHAQKVLQILTPEAKRAHRAAEQNGGIPRGSQYAEALFIIVRTMQSIADLGVEIKDLERGLCDFPALHEGRVVYLCWVLGEDRIEWWHDLETGFAGRQPL